MIFEVISKVDKPEKIAEIHGSCEIDEILPNILATTIDGGAAKIA